MKKTLPLLFLGFFAIATSAQEDQELTTYFAEKAKFRIDFPDTWNTNVSEVKSLLGYGTSIISSDLKEEGTNVIVLSGVGCKSPESFGKSYKKVFERGAKKNNDTSFRINDEGLTPDQDGKKYYWLDYIHTLVLDDGRKIVLREFFVTRCHYAGLNKYSNTFRFQTKEENWDTNKPLFDKIYSTARFE